MRSITKIIIMFVVIFFFNERNILGQNTFFKWNATSTYEYIYSLTYLIDNSFLLAGYGGSESGNYRAFLLQLDQNGNEINRRFSTEDTVESLYTIPFFIHDSLFILKTVYSNVDDKVFENLCFCNIFIADLNSQVRKKYQFNANHFRLPQEVCNIDDNIYVLYLQDHNSSNETKGRGYSITKYNQAFNTVNSYYDTNYSIVAGGFGLVRNSEKSQLKCIFNNWFDLNIITLFNYDLELQKVNRTDPYITAFSACNFDDSSYLTTGVHYLGDPYLPARYVVTRKYDWNDILLDSAYYINTTDDTVSYSGFRNNTLKTDARIFVTGTYNVVPSEWPYQNEPSWIELTIYDTALSRLKKCFYGGDAFYECWSITQTPDNAVLIAGNRYDHNEPGYLYHPFLLKVTTDGLLTANNNEPEKRAHDAIVFPNPGREYLSVRSGPQIFGATFELFDLNGRLVKQEIISNQTTTISTTNLATGTYVWRILYKNKEVESGKWIKSL